VIVLPNHRTAGIEDGILGGGLVVSEAGTRYRVLEDVFMGNTPCSGNAASRNSLRSPTDMASKKKTKQTRRAAATASSRVLKNLNSTEAAKTAAASALSQTGRAARTGEKAASSAGRALAQNATSPRGRKAAGSALSQAPRKRKTKSS
jgi:hypothetical protein